LGERIELGNGPWHSVNSGIYHDNPNCQSGNSIAPENVRRTYDFRTATKRVGASIRR
jgi:hypothetical protein